MKTSQIGSLICRVAALAFAVWYLPPLVCSAVALILSRGPYSHQTQVGTIAGSAGMLFLGSLLWSGARRIGRAFVNLEDSGPRLQIDGAHFAAIAFAIIGIGTFVSNLGFLDRIFVSMEYPDWEKSPLVVRLLFSSLNGSPLVMLLGLILLLVAPRLGIWLENATFRGEEAGDEPA